MGVMRFVVHPPELIQDWPEALQAYLSGMDGRIFPTKVELENQTLCCRRSLSDSGKLNVPWPVEGVGRPVLTTASLREREEPYLLSLELARGKLSEVRDQRAVWEMAKMSVPDAFAELQSQAFRCFARASAVQADRDAASTSAREALVLACRAANILVDAYVVQRMSSIRRAHHAPSLLGCVLDETVLTEEGEKVFREAFNTAAIPVQWKDIEPNEGNYNWEPADQLVNFCSSQRMIVRGGPLIDLQPNGLPAWLAPWQDDFLNLPSFVCDFIDTAVSRYTGLIRIWEVSSAGNTGGALGLGEEHRLALVARTLEAAIRTDSDSQFFIRIEQPWGEYQRHGQHRLSPFQFVDALVRSNLGLTGVSLNVNVGFGNGACFTRDMISVSKLIDLWSLLGVQIHINLACPSGSSLDPRADAGIEVQDSSWNKFWSEETQAEWLERIIPLLMAKPTVTGIFLNQFSDAAGHRFPHAGLLRPDGTPKKMLDPLRRQLQNEIS